MLQAEKLSQCDRYQRQALRLDVYRQPFSLLLPDGYETYRSFIGALLSIFSLVIMLTYGSYKFTRLMHSDDYQV